MIRRSIISLCFILSAAALSAADSAYREILREDFSLFTAGSETRPSANPVCDNLQYIPETKTHTPGWQGVEIYQAGGMAFQGGGGRLFTPDLDLSQNGGSFRVSFRMKLASGSPEGYANVVHSKVDNHIAEKLTTDWQTIVLELDGGIANDWLCIRGIDPVNPSSSKVKVLIDDIVVEVPDPDVTTPKGVTYDNFNGTSFTAYWHSVDRAEKYELQLFTYNRHGNPEYVVSDISTTRTQYSFSDLDEEWNAYYLQVRAVAGDKYSPWSVPLLIEGLCAPVLKEASDLSSNGFTASWEPVDRAVKYDLSVYYSHTAQADEQFYQVDTDFGFVKKVNLGSQIDVGFEQLPGWFFGAAELQDGYVGIQGAFAYLNYAAQIESPALYLGSSGGRINVEFRAKNDDARTGVAVALYNPQNGDFAMADSYETELSKNWFTVKASLSGGIDGSILAIIPTRSGNVYVDDLKVWQNVKAGTESLRTAAKEETAEEYFTFENLACPEGDNIACKVRAIGISEDGKRWLYSEYTPLQYPYASISSVKDAVITPEDASAVYYNLQGVEVTNPSGGVYIVRRGNTVTKELFRK